MASSSSSRDGARDGGDELTLRPHPPGPTKPFFGEALDLRTATSLDSAAVPPSPLLRAALANANRAPSSLGGSAAGASSGNLASYLTPQTAALAAELSALAVMGTSDAPPPLEVAAARDGAPPEGAPLHLVVKKIDTIYSKVLAPEGTLPGTLPVDAFAPRPSVALVAAAAKESDGGGTPTAAASPSPSTTLPPVSPRAARFARAGGLPVVLGSLRAALEARDGSRAWGAAVARGARLAAAAVAASPECWRALAMVERADAVCVPCELLAAALGPSNSSSSSNSRQLGTAALAVPALLDLLLDLVSRDAAAAALLLAHGGLAPAAEVMALGAEALLPKESFSAPSSAQLQQQRRSGARRPSSSSSLASESHFSGSPGSSLPSSPRGDFDAGRASRSSEGSELGDFHAVAAAAAEDDDSMSCSASSSLAVAAAAEGARATAAALCAAVLAGVPKLRRGGGDGGLGGSSAALSEGMFLGGGEEEEQQGVEDEDEDDGSLWPAAPGATRLAEAAALALHALTTAAASAAATTSTTAAHHHHPPPSLDLLLLPPNAPQLLAAARGALGVLAALAARGGGAGTAAAKGALSLSLLQPSLSSSSSSSPSQCPCACFLAAVSEAAKAWGDPELAAEASELREELASGEEEAEEDEQERARKQQGQQGLSLFSSLASAVGAWWS